MKHLLNKNVKDLEISGIRQILNKVIDNPDIVNLTFGQPDFPTPDYIKEAGKKALDDNHTGYTTNAGLLELRKSASRYVEKLYGLNYCAEDEILITTGASEAIDITLRTILEPGCEVLMPAPIYSGYEPIVRLCDATPVFMDTTKENFKITAQLIEKHVTDKTRCIILNSPSNPIGIVYTEEEIIEISAFLKDKDIFILSDEVYSEITYDGKKNISIASMPGMKDKTIVINALSKSHAMTGWRIGFLFAPAYLVEELLKVHSFAAICASSIAQIAAIEALDQGMDTQSIVSMIASYKERRDYVYDRIVKMGLQVVKPEGAFYIFPEIPKNENSSAEFVDKLINEAKVAVIPGSAFSPYGEGYFRISYAQSIEMLQLGMDRLEEFVRQIN